MMCLINLTTLVFAIFITPIHQAATTNNATNSLAASLSEGLYWTRRIIYPKVHANLCNMIVTYEVDKNFARDR
ncbi:hypothetical protein Hanom_Chr09g00841891 [Helianthus anomalus]